MNVACPKANARYISRHLVQFGNSPTRQQSHVWANDCIERTQLFVERKRSDNKMLEKKRATSSSGNTNTNTNNPIQQQQAKLTRNRMMPVGLRQSKGTHQFRRGTRNIHLRYWHWHWHETEEEQWYYLSWLVVSSVPHSNLNVHDTIQRDPPAWATLVFLRYLNIKMAL